MNCSECGEAWLDKAKFCPRCGAARAKACPSCGKLSPQGARFCMECGAALSTAAVPREAPKSDARPPRPSDRPLRSSRSPSGPSGERKHVTALFCDVVGSTTLAERLGAEVFHELLSRFFRLALDEVHRYEGSINKFLGDGFLALFGVPITHEHHARRAVLAALGIKRALEEVGPEILREFGVSLASRIGLNTGVVVVGTLGDNLEADYTAIGDTMNVASRLQALGEPGDILMGETTARLVEGHARLAPMGPVVVRGKSEPIAVYRVVGLSRRRSPRDGIDDRSRSRFVGRDRERSLIRDFMARAELGSGRAVGVVAEPGMGKSRLVLEVRRSLGAARVTYLQGACLSYGSTVPYLPIIDILRHNMGIEDGDLADVIAAKVRFGLREVGMDADECADYILNVLGLRVPGTRLASLSAEAIRTRTFKILRDLCLEGSRRRPILLVVEDLHWVDRISEQFLRYLVESIDSSAILFIGTYRPGYSPPWAELAHSTEIALRPLLLDECSEMVGLVLAEGGAEDAIRRAIVAKAEGNPFFLEELAKTASEQAVQVVESAVPGTIQDVLMSRIDRLPDASKRVLQTASVIGREVPLRLLSAIWDGEDSLTQGLSDLTSREFLFEQERVDGPVYVFRHALTQDVAYESLLLARRRALHAAVGRAIEEQYAVRLEEAYDRLAYHYAKTTETQKAIEFLRRSAEKAARSHAYVEAVASMEEAQAHAERLPEPERHRCVIEILLRQPHWLWSLGRFADARDRLLREQERVERLADPALLGSYYAWLGLMANYLDERERAAICARRALEEASKCGDNVTIGRSRYVLAAEGYVLGRFREGAEHGRLGAAILEATDDRWWYGQINWMTGVNCVLLGDFEGALAAFEKSGAIGGAIGDPRIMTYTMMFTSLTYTSMGEWDIGVEWAMRALKTAPDPFTTVSSTAFLGNAYRESGDIERAFPCLSSAVQRYTAFRVPRIESWFSAYLAEITLRRGDVGGARVIAQRALAVSQASSFGYIVGFCERVLAQIAAAAGDLDAGFAHIDASLATYASIEARFEEGRTHLTASELAELRGDRVRMEKHLRWALERFSSPRVPKYLAIVEQRAHRAAVRL